MGLLFISCRLALFLFPCPSVPFEYSDDSHSAALPANNTSLGNSASYSVRLPRLRPGLPSCSVDPGPMPAVRVHPSMSRAALLGSSSQGLLVFPNGATPLFLDIAPKSTAYAIPQGYTEGGRGHLLKFKLASWRNRMHRMGF